MLPKMFIQDFKLIQNFRLNNKHFILTLLAPEKLPEIFPGQFVQVLVENSPSTFLRRPLSIHSVDYANNTVSLMIQIKGEGTRHLSLLQGGDTLNLIYPLGNYFTIPEQKEVLLVGGGCGVAPLLFLAQTLHDHDIEPDILLGFRTREEVSEIETFSKYGKVRIITDDGTEGEKGLVTDHSIFQKESIPYKKIFCCGPDPMMKAIARIAKIHHIDCEVSLENMMACGFGVCLCCATPTDKGNERVCMEGPVFNTKRLNWK